MKMLGEALFVASYFCHTERGVLLMCQRLGISLFCFCFLVATTALFAHSFAQESIEPENDAVWRLSKLPIAKPIETHPLKKQDWLIDNTSFVAGVARSPNSKELILQNGLVRRVFRVAPNGATVALDNLVTGESLLRGVKPEALITIDGRELAVGGLTGQPNFAYLLPEWVDKMKPIPDSMSLVGFAVGEPKERLKWARRRHHEPDAKWPPQGVHLRMDYKVGSPRTDSSKTEDQPDALAGVTVSIHYELHDGIPVFCKWLTIHNATSKTIQIDRLTTEMLAIVEHSSWVETRPPVDLPKPQCLHVETDFASGGFNHENANRHVVRWANDPEFSTQVNYLRSTPCLLEVSPTYGPAQKIGNTAFESYRTFELVYDSTDRERRGLALRKMYRTIAPWTTENPLMHHLLNSDPKQVRAAIDQAAEVGFEMIILSFGSGFNMDNENQDYLETWKGVADYADSKGIEIGSYSLLSSRGAPKGNMIVCPEGQRPTHGRCPALTSEWGLDYFERLRKFYETTGFDLLEHDGSYPGDVDVTPRPPLQQGEQDSRWAQWRIITEYYHWCRERGIYLNVPDYYLLSGSNKVGMGYREVNWSLPRAMQVIHTRQNIFDGAWTKTPSMGWMFVPLSQYHGGGAAATIEPLNQHLDHYRRMLDCNLALGVQACYRGPRLFDTEQTKELVRERVAWFKKYREILESDLVHGRRADGRDLDWMLHVNPNLNHKGMLVVFNPLKQTVVKPLAVNLYYTGLTDKARVTDATGKLQDVKLDRDYSVRLKVEVPAEGMSWYLIE